MGKKVELTGGAHLPGTGYGGTRLGERKGGTSRRTWARVVAWIKARLIMLEEKQAKGAGAAKAIENAGVCSRLCVPSHTHVARCCASCLKKVVFVVRT